MSLAANAIITVADLRLFIGKAQDAIKQDDILELAINMVSGAIEDYLGGPVKSTSYDGRIFDGSGRQIQRVDRGPILELLNGAVTDVQYRQTPADDWQNLETDVRYVLIPREDPWGLQLWRGHFPVGTQNVRIRYKGGYVTTPQTIVRVALEACMEIFKESGKGDGRLGVSSSGNTAGGSSGSTSYVRLGETHRRELKAFRRIIL